MIGPWHCESKLLCHVQVIWQHVIWQLPIKTMHKLGHRLTNHSMKKSPTMQSSVDWCGISNGATGCSLMLSFITISKYSNFSKSDSSTFLFIPTTLSNSI
ncbi:hypothetical protein CR513_31653, partial [Mucuna pruriens]